MQRGNRDENEKPETETTLLLNLNTGIAGTTLVENRARSSETQVVLVEDNVALVLNELKDINRRYE